MKKKIVIKMPYMQKENGPEKLMKTKQKGKTPIGQTFFFCYTFKGAKIRLDS